VVLKFGTGGSIKWLYAIIVENQYIIINTMFLLTEFWVNYIYFNNSIDGGGRKYGDG